MKNNLWYSIVAAFSLWALDEIYIFRPEFFFVALSLGALIITFGVRFLIGKKSAKFWPAFVPLPLLFYLSFSFYSAMIVSGFWIQIIFLLNAWFIFYYLSNIHYYSYFNAPEREAKLRRLILSGSFLAAFATAAALYALPIFLSWPSVFFLLIFIAAAFILFGQSLIFNPGADRSQKIFLLINILVLAEFAGALLLLPLNFNILGFLVALVFYFLVFLYDRRSLNDLNLKNIKWPIALISAIIILILLTARWL